MTLDYWNYGIFRYIPYYMQVYIINRIVRVPYYSYCIKTPQNPILIMKAPILLQATRIGDFDKKHWKRIASCGHTYARRTLPLSLMPSWPRNPDSTCKTECRDLRTSDAHAKPSLFVFRVCSCNLAGVAWG